MATLAPIRTFKPKRTFYNHKLIKDIILRDLGVGPIVYSPIFGDLKFCGYKNGLVFKTATNKQVKFNDDGKFDPSGDLMLFPSKDEKDWTTVPIKYPSSLQELHECIGKEPFCKDEAYLKRLEEKSPIRYLRFLLFYLDFLSINTEERDRFANNEKLSSSEYNRTSDNRKYIYEIYHKSNTEWGKRILRDDYAVLACRSEKSAEKFLELVPSSLLDKIFSDIFKRYRFSENN